MDFDLYKNRFEKAILAGDRLLASEIINDLVEKNAMKPTAPIYYQEILTVGAKTK